MNNYGHSLLAIDVANKVLDVIKEKEKLNIKTLRDELALDILVMAIKDSSMLGTNMRDQVYDAYHYADIMLEVRAEKKEVDDEE